jgi:ferredoxin
MNITSVACRDPEHELDVLELPGLMVLDDLCTRPGRLADIEGADRLVLVLHDGDYVPAQIQKQTRTMGVDPVGVQIVRAQDAAGDPARLAVMIAGAQARGMAFTGAESEQVKPVIPTRLSRRSLLSFPQPIYEAVPKINTGVCAAGAGCRACVGECPQNSYRWIDGHVIFDKDACVSCGRCVTICPTGAIENATISGPAVRAQITAMVEAAPGPIGVAFLCTRRTQSVTADGWFGIEVPCASMVPGTWPVAALTLGAGAATMLACSATGCSLQHDEVVASKVAFGRTLAEAAGLDPDLIPVEATTTPATESSLDIALVDPFGVHGPRALIAALATRESDTTILFDHPASPLGVVEIDPATCTMCTMCSSTCPTGALQHVSTGDSLELTFDANLCTACNQCVPRCPEIDRGAIMLRRRVDTIGLEWGRSLVNQAETLACEICGKPVAPSVMMDRIGELLGNDFADTIDYLNRRCMDCRGL